MLALPAVLAVGGYSFDSVTRVSLFVCEFAGLFVLKNNIFRFRSFSHLMFGIFIKTIVISRMIIEWLIDILKVSLSI